MADVYNPNQDDENKQQQQSGQVQVASGMQGAPASPGGQGPGVRTASGSGQGGQGQQQGSGRFTNIQKYLKANQGNQIGQQLGQSIQKEAEKPLNEIGSAKDQLQQTIQGEQARLGTQASGLMDRVKSFASSQGGQLQEEDYNQFGQLRQGQAATPQIQNMQNLEAGAGKVSALANSAGTETGRFDLLKQFYGRPTYSTGQQRLDQLLLQTNPQQAKALQTGAAQIDAQTKAQIDALKSMQTTGQQDIATQAAARQAEVNSLLGTPEDGSGLLGGLQKGIQTRTNELMAKEKAAREVLQNVLSGKGYSSEAEMDQALAAVKAAGINPEQYKMYDIARNANFRPEQFLNNLNINQNNVATADEKSKLDALYKLAGKEQNYLGDVQSPANLSSILDSDALKNAAASREAEYQSVSKPYASSQEFYKAITSGAVSPAKLVETLKKYGLSNENANMIMTSQEVAGRPSGPGMHAEPYHLDQFLFGNSSYSKNLNDAIKNAASGINKEYGAGTTLSDLIKRYQTLPTQGTQDFGSLPIATGPGGRMGLF